MRGQERVGMTWDLGYEIHLTQSEGMIGGKDGGGRDGQHDGGDGGEGPPSE